ncbi:hypothetical protein DXB86_05540 [Collinsella sp. OM06-18AC]|nr:hypothetical protein DXB86_05540 [Collinsella sp. OM06-18AC]
MVVGKSRGIVIKRKQGSTIQINDSQTIVPRNRKDQQRITAGILNYCSIKTTCCFAVPIKQDLIKFVITKRSRKVNDIVLFNLERDENEKPGNIIPMWNLDTKINLRSMSNIGPHIN